MHEGVDEELRDDILEYLRERKASGGSFVKATHVAREFDDVAPQKAGLYLKDLEDRGHLERYNPDANRCIWRIQAESQ